MQVLSQEVGVCLRFCILGKFQGLEQSVVLGWLSPGSRLDLQNLRPRPGPMNQNLHFNQAQVSQVHVQV